MSAQGTATDAKAMDAKATAPDALNLLQRKGKKGAGKADLAAALLSGSRKGSVSFARIFNGKISATPGEKTGAGSIASSLAAAAAGLKNGSHTALNPRGAAMKNPLLGADAQPPGQ